MNDTPVSDQSPANPAGFTRGKLFAAYASLALIGAVLWPLHENWRTTPRDDFPLSYYPMFSTKRDAIETFYYMIGHDKKGERITIPYRFAGPGGLNSTRRQIRKLTQDGHAAELAQSVARRLARNDSSRWEDIVSVSIMRGRYSVADWYHGKKQPVAEQLKGFAVVERSVQ
jgi:hypothetical protein